MKRYRIRKYSIAYCVIEGAKILSGVALLYIMCVLGFAL